MAYTPLPNPWTGIPLVGALVDAIQDALVAVTTAVEDLTTVVSAIVTNVSVRLSGTEVGSRPAINFVPSTGVGIAVTDDNPNDEVDVAISTTAILPTIVDAKGDLIVGSAADTVIRVAAGTNGYQLQAESGQASGMLWTPDYSLAIWPYVTRSAVELTRYAGINTSDVLTCNVGLIPAGYLVTYQWIRTDTGATLGTNQTYTVQAADAAYTYQIQCIVFVSNAGGTRNMEYPTVRLGGFKTAFVYTGTVQAYTVPVVVTNLIVKMWGGGGGAGGADTGSNQGGIGGAGGFVNAAITAVTAGNIHDIYVAGGGGGGAGNATGTGGGAGGYVEGGAGGNAGSTGASGAGGGGGGWSGIVHQDDVTIMACAAGAGGGTGGAGGNVNVFGKGGNNQTSANGTSTAGLAGTNYVGDGGGGGGTGGGRFGGGTKSPGRADAGGDVTKSDGGLNFVNGTYATTTTNTTGADNSTAGTQTGDADYVATAGAGGAAQSNAAGLAGQNGRVVVIGKG